MAYISFQPSDYFNTKLWSGDDTSPRSLTGIGFQPDWTIIKKRSTAGSHVVFDAVRTAGSTKGLATNSTAQEGLTATEGTTAVYGYVSSFDSDGFTVTAGTGAGANSDAYVNNTSDNYVAWNWKANGAGVSNTDGSITSTVSANTTSGFSIVKWTGSGANATIGHGLGVAPKVVIIKNTSSAENWVVGHSSIGFTNFLQLNTTAVEATASNRFNDTAPTSSVFSVGTETQVNKGGDNMIAYVFAEKKGFSKMGLYNGNSSTDGTFVFTGFKPSFVLLKGKGALENWSILDNKRNTFNVMDKYLDPNSTNAEGTADIWDFTSNGFKMRNTFSGYNASGQGYIYMAFAEEPLVSSNDIPATAR